MGVSEQVRRERGEHRDITPVFILLFELWYKLCLYSGKHIFVSEKYPQ